LSYYTKVINLFNEKSLNKLCSTVYGRAAYNIESYSKTNI